MSREVYLDVNGAAGDKPVFVSLVEMLRRAHVPVFFFTDSPASDAAHDLARNGITAAPEEVLRGRKLEQKAGTSHNGFKPIPAKGDILVVESDKSTGPEGVVYQQKYGEYLQKRNPEATVVFVAERDLTPTEEQGLVNRVRNWLLRN